MVAAPPKAALDPSMIPKKLHLRRIMFKKCESSLENKNCYIFPVEPSEIWTLHSGGTKVRGFPDHIIRKIRFVFLNAGQ
jgi:hypothetical protein